MAKGYIPEQVEYYCRKPKKIKITWDEAWHVKDKNVIWEGEAIPTYPIPGNATDRRRASAKEWAGVPHHKLVNGKYVLVPSQGYDEYSFSNDPFKIIMCSLEHRGNGGRAYKVMTEEGFYFDLREDVLLEALLNVGCEAGGFLGGKYLWMMGHNNMKLIREGSQVHIDMVAATQRYNAAPLLNDQLLEGNVYCGKDERDQALFLGEVIVGRGKPKLLFFPISRYDNKTPQQQFDAYQQPDHHAGVMCFYQYTFKTSHKYVQQVDEVVLPEDHIEKIRVAALAEMRKRIDENYAARGHHPNLKDCKKFFRPLVHMHQAGQTMPVIPEYAPRKRAKK